MTCQDENLRYLHLCHKCSRYRNAWNSNIETHLNCKPQINPEAQHLLAQKRQHKKAIKAVDQELEKLVAPNQFTLHGFNHFNRFNVSPIAEEK